MCPKKREGSDASSVASGSSSATKKGKKGKKGKGKSKGKKGEDVSEVGPSDSISNVETPKKQKRVSKFDGEINVATFKPEEIKSVLKKSEQSEGTLAADSGWTEVVRKGRPKPAARNDLVEEGRENVKSLIKKSIVVRYTRSATKSSSWSG